MHKKAYLKYAFCVLVFTFSMNCFGKNWLSQKLNVQLDSLKSSNEYGVNYLLWSCGMVKTASPAIDTLNFEILRYLHSRVDYEQEFLMGLNFCTAIKINLSCLDNPSVPIVNNCPNVGLAYQILNAITQYQNDYPNAVLMDSIFIIGKTKYSYYTILLSDFYDNGITISDLNLIEHYPNLFQIVHQFIAGKNEYFELIKQIKNKPTNEELYPQKHSLNVVMPKHFLSLSIGGTRYITKEKTIDGYKLSYNPNDNTALAFLGMYIDPAKIDVVLSVYDRTYISDVTFEPFTIGKNEMYKVFEKLPCMENK